MSNKQQPHPHSHMYNNREPYIEPQHRRGGYLPPVNTPAKSFFTFVLCLLSIIFISIFLFFAVLRPGNMRAFIRNTDIAWVLEETGVQGEINSALDNFPAHSAYDPIVAAQVEEFIQRENVSSEVADVIGGFVYAFVEGNLDHHLTTDEIIAMARNLEPEIEAQFGYSMTDEDFRILETTLRHVELESLTVGSILDETDFNTDVMATVFSIYPLLIFGVLSILSLLCIFAVNGRNIPKALRASGISIFLPGLLYFPLGLLLIMSPGVLRGALYIFARVISGPATVMMQYGIICIIIGIALMITSPVVRRAARNKQFSV